MAQLWIEDKGEAVVVPLDSEAFLLSGDLFGLSVARLARPLDRLASVVCDSSLRGSRSNRVALLYRPGAGSMDGGDGRAGVAAKGWVALAIPGVLRVNGVASRTGIRVLAHRDQLRAGESPPLFFSTEELAQVVSFAGKEGLVCPRCKITIEKPALAVRCPRCDVWYHQDESIEKPCWTFGPKCVTCTQPTDLDAGYRWVPEGFFGV
ncbi:MAG: PHD finger domain-containing protein [Candidatus Binatia bacterium]